MKKGFLKILAVAGILFLAVSAHGQIWYDNYNAAEKKCEETGKPMLVIFLPERSMKSNTLINSREFKNFARNNLVLMHVKTIYKKVNGKYTYVPVKPQNSKFADKFEVEYSTGRLYDPKSGKTSTISVWSEKIDKTIERMENFVKKVQID